MISKNREEGVNGEAYFFYEGLKKNDNKLGNYLHQEFYEEKAIVPLRDGHIWRPEAAVWSSAEAEYSGSWEEVGVKGFQDNPIKRSVFSGDETPPSMNYQSEKRFGGVQDIFLHHDPFFGNSVDSLLLEFTQTSSDETVAVRVAHPNGRDGWYRAGQHDFGEYAVYDNLTVSAAGNVSGDSDTLYNPSVMLQINREKTPEYLDSAAVSISERDAEKPDRISTIRAYPNPFNPRARVEVEVRETAPAVLRMYNLLGQEVYRDRKLIYAGRKNRFTVDGRDLASGVYLVVVRSAGQKMTTRITLVK